MTLFAFAPSFCSPPSRHLMVPVTSVDQANVTLVVPAGPVTSGPLLSMTQVSPGIPATPTAATTLFEAASPTRSAQAHPVCVRPARAVPSAEYREHAEHEEKAAAIWVRRGPKYDKALIQNLAGKRRDLDYGHFRAKARGQQQTISAYVAAKLRLPADARLEATNPIAPDLLHVDLVLPACTPPALRTATALWQAVDQEVWRHSQDLAVVVTWWFHQPQSAFSAHREICGFVDRSLVQPHALAAHVITHAPRRRGGSGPVHVHAILTARELTEAGLGRHIQDVCNASRGQTNVFGLWDAYKRTLPPGTRP